MTPNERPIVSSGWMPIESTFGRIWQSVPSRSARWYAADDMPSGWLNSCSGGMRNCTRTSVKRLGMRLPWRSRNGTPRQRQLSTSARSAT